MKSGLEKIFMKLLHALTMSFLLLNFDQKYKFSNKNNMVSAWSNFKNIFPRPLFIIIFRPEMLKFHSYSILTGDTRVEFVISCVLRRREWIGFYILDQRASKRYLSATWLRKFKKVRTLIATTLTLRQFLIKRVQSCAMIRSNSLFASPPKVFLIKYCGLD